ncbi:MAG: hypothetical protein HY924_12470 [Elusimicrobia bacterium]|nr:hypothetical protein [Elusimicrobiota bacterium]
MLIPASLLLSLAGSIHAAGLIQTRQAAAPASPYAPVLLPSLPGTTLRPGSVAGVDLSPGVAGLGTPVLELPSAVPDHAVPGSAFPASPSLPAVVPQVQGAAAPSEGGASAASAVGSLAEAETQGRLEGSLPAFFDRSAPGNAAETVRLDYDGFLGRVGFRDYPSAISAGLAKPGLTETQRKVLEFNAKRYRVMNAARSLASDVMAGLAEQGFSPESLETATELTARLLSLQPLDPPSSLPAEIARKDKEGIRAWLISVTVQKLSAQLGQVVSDIAKAAVPQALLEQGLKDLSEGRKDATAGREVSRRVAAIKDAAEVLLVAAYTDAEAGQTRYAGRALAAALVRHSRLEGRPEVEQGLRAKVAERGQHLENFIGNTLVLPDLSSPGGLKRIEVRTGDFLGERSGGREAAEITFGVRPQLRLWWKAFRQGLLGHPLGLWANPKGGPGLKDGQPVRNRLRQLLWGFKHWLAERSFLRNGYSHVGMATVEESDGVALAWALDNYPNSGEGGIRKIGIAEEFAQHGPFIKFGAARLDADKVWDAFHAQAAERGYMSEVYKSGSDPWPSLLSPEEYQGLLSIPRKDSARLLAELSRRAAAAVEELMTRLGTGFAYGFVNEIWRAYCSSTVMLGWRMGAQFEVQEAYDHFHPLVLLMKKLGLPGAKDQRTDGRIIWPGSLFIDPKVASHQAADYTRYRELGKVTNPYTVPAYVEMDPALTAQIMILARLSGRDIAPDKDVISAAIVTHLDNRGQKGRAKAGYSSGAAPVTGYSAGLDGLLEEASGD